MKSFRVLETCNLVLTATALRETDIWTPCHSMACPQVASKEKNLTDVEGSIDYNEYVGTES